MKKFTSVLIMCVFVALAFAQERTAIQMGKLDADFGFAKSNDTLAPMSFINGAELTYYITVQQGTTDTGYVCGTNWYGDVAKAQQFLYEMPYNLVGCLVWVAAKKGTTGNVQFKVYQSNGNGTANSGAVNYAPGTVLSTVSKPFSQINGGLSFAEGSNYFQLTTPLAITGDYYVGLDFSQMGAFPANKLGIVSCVDGGAQGTDLSWELWDNNAWYSMLGSWPLDFDMMFFPIVTTQGADVQEYFINNVIMNVYPNPVSDVATIEYELKNSANNVHVTIHDLTGKGVINLDLGAQNAGNHSVKIDVSQLAAGTYIYSLQADKNRLAKKFTVK
jgi:hypothetical protein